MDASEVVYSAHAPTQQIQLAQPFTAAEQARMDANAFSSTEREVRGYARPQRRAGFAVALS